jgi:hypothetical protein
MHHIVTTANLMQEPEYMDFSGTFGIKRLRLWSQVERYVYYARRCSIC